MTYSLDQANAALDGILQTANTDINLAKSQFVTLIQQLDVTATGKVTVTYSGAGSRSLVDSLGDDVRLLDNTAASEFLSGVNDGTKGQSQNIKLMNVLETLYGPNPFRDGSVPGLPQQA